MEHLLSTLLLNVLFDGNISRCTTASKAAIRTARDSKTKISETNCHSAQAHQTT